ncbi:MAG TPA: beta-galactosidase GalA [Tepidisphaeraceae bacterium]|jgi:beta-galactosidase
MRQRLSLDRGWRFALGHAADASRDFEFARDRSLVKSGEARGAAGTKFDDSKWQRVDLPHDWALQLPLDHSSDDREPREHAFRAIGPDHPENSIGWYRRTFDIPKSDLGNRISVEFDGVFRDCIVWINGHRLGRHASGHTSFAYDLTDLLNYGGSNVLAVRVDATCWEGWWYEGAGIYRHVWLVKTSPVHVGRWGTFVTSEVRGRSAVVTVRTTVVNGGDDSVTCNLKSQISNSSKKSRIKLAPWSQAEVVQKIRISKPKLWSPNEPNLYKLVTTIEGHDRYQTTFGIRTMRWDAKRGFFLNGKPLKIKGTCNHQNHAGVGTAMPDRLHELRIEKLKQMGSNAYRCSHYAATPELLDACDRLGMMVMAENRLADVGPQFLDDFTSMIRRDRNHPSIILWSIGNEEHTIQWSLAGERIGRTLVRTAHQLDPTRKVTAAMHDRGLNEGFANVVDVHGWNYIKVGDIEAFHKRRPDQPIVGTEEGSTVCTRGEYEDDAKRGYVSAYDVRAPKWGSTAEDWWTFFATRRWLAGGFVWTGFDYRGEPIPYKWPCTSSHFGLMDLCGFPKDLCWYFRSWWRDEPVLHLFPHWNWRGKEGEAIDVRVFSNCERVELFLNGRSLGSQSIRRNSHAGWKVNYQAGTLEAHGYRDGRRITTSKVETTGAGARIELSVDRSIIDAGGDDLAFITASAVDSSGRPVPTASNLIHFGVSGAAKILGVGNGDPSSHESDKARQRRLFSGLAMILVQSTERAGIINVTARSRGLKPARIQIRAKPGRRRLFVDAKD